MRLHSLNLQDISIQDPFWSKHVDLVRNAIIPYQWEAMNDRIPDAESSHCLENFKIAAGREKGEFYGAVFQDTDVAKWLEAVGFSLACYPDAALEATADEVIDLIAEAQCDDGYINTYFTIKEPDKRWTDLVRGMSSTRQVISWRRQLPTMREPGSGKCWTVCADSRI